MTYNPYVNDSGLDHVTGIWHCIDCGEAVIQHDKILKNHLITSWQHFGWINYPALFNNDGSVKTPARLILAPIPVQTTFMLCIECMPKFKDTGCAKCGNEVDTTIDEHSTMESLERFENLNKNFQKRIFHYACLPSYLDKVREYKELYS